MVSSFDWEQLGSMVSSFDWERREATDGMRFAAGTIKIEKFKKQKWTKEHLKIEHLKLEKENWGNRKVKM